MTVEAAKPRSLLRRLYDWCVGAAGKPHAIWILTAGAFAESSFFPIPPDVMLVPMSLARPDRADTILPATAIFLRIAKKLDLPTIVAPGVGLAQGMLEEIVDKFFHVWDAAGEAERVIDACARLGRHYHYDEAHAKCVTRFATQLFDD